MTKESNHTGASEEGSFREGRSSFLSRISEDIWAVIIGGLLVLVMLVLAFSYPALKFSTPVFRWRSAEELAKAVFSLRNLLPMAVTGIIFFVLSFPAVLAAGGKIKHYAGGFFIVYLAAMASLVISGNGSVHYYGIEYVVFALLIGLLLSNLFSLPSWIRDAARSEFFIKTGLVILGTNILFTDIMQAGMAGIIQSVLVVAVVWFVALWLARRLKVDDEFGVILASAVSICGVSAAIVASGAIKGDKKKLSYVTTLVLLVAIPMLILMPWIIRKLGINEVVGGAWLGGTLDTTASVAAAAELVGPAATKAGVIVKFSQNVLIGVAAFLIAAWWVWRKPGTENENREKRSIGLVWQRFPKFVLGFLAASMLFSFVIPPETGKQVSGVLNSFRTTWFALAFVSIGIEARFADLFGMQRGRPALAFIIAQVFNILWTLLWAWLLFGGVLIPAPKID